MSGNDKDALAEMWLAGDLLPEDIHRWELLLSQDPSFAAEMDALGRISEALRELSPDLLIDGPAKDAQLLARRTANLAETHHGTPADSRAAIRSPSHSLIRGPSRRTRSLVAAAGAVLALTLAGVFAATHSSEQHPISASSTQSTPKTIFGVPSRSQPNETLPTVTPSDTPPASTFVAMTSNQDRRTGATMQVQLTSSNASLRVRAEVTDVPAGQVYRIYVISHGGQRELAGSFQTPLNSSEAPTTFNGTVLMARADVADVVLEDTTAPVVTVPIRSWRTGPSALPAA